MARVPEVGFRADGHTDGAAFGEVQALVALAVPRTPMVKTASSSSAASITLSQPEVPPL
jgi:hypothetical protein